jgi:hypothetical protein
MGGVFCLFYVEQTLHIEGISFAQHDTRLHSITSIFLNYYQCLYVNVVSSVCAGASFFATVFEGENSLYNSGLYLNK